MQHYHAILTAPFYRKTAPGGSCASLHSQHLGFLPGAFSAEPLASLSPSLAVAWPKLGIRMCRTGMCKCRQRQDAGSDQGAALGALDFVSPEVDDLPAENPDAANVVQQLMRYFSDPAYVFSMPLACTGTPFQQRVWQALREVPAGQPCRYGDLARRLSSGPRAVGGACRANPVPIVVPCHRVVSATGLGGYSGVTQGFSPEVASGILPLATLAHPCAALAIKRWLLDHERG